MSARQFRRAREQQVKREERRAEVRRKTKIAGAAGAAIGATALFAPAAQAATFTVNSLDDPGDGTCDDECTLREAVEAANDAHGADTIVFATSLSGTIHLTDEDIDIYDGNEPEDYGGLDIQGPGPGVITVDAGYDSRIFDVGGFFNPGTPVRIGGLRLRAGSAEGDGGAIRNEPRYDAYAASLTVDGSVITDSYTEDNGGAIFNYEEYLDSLAITNTRISDNEANEDGGGVFTAGSSVTITGSRLDGNSARGSGGGLLVASAEGDESTPAVRISDSVFTRNHARGFTFYENQQFYEETGNGGGIFFADIDGTTIIEQTTVSYNEAGTVDNEDPEYAEYQGAGGGIVFGEMDDVTLTGSTISGNRARKYSGDDPYDPLGGGGLVVVGTFGEFVVENSTISGNEAMGDGGGAWLDPIGAPPIFRNTTITDNDAYANGEGQGGVGGGLFLSAYGNDAYLSSTVVAENNAADGGDLYTEGAPEPQSQFFLEFSLIGDVEDARYDASAGGNILGGTVADPPIDPLIAPLSDNGGPTETHLPLAGSPALDAGISNGLATDQRGLPRTVDLPDVANADGSDATDIGSVEVQGEPPPPPPAEPAATGECKGSQVPLISGTDAPEELAGTPGSDLIRAGGGGDRVDGLEADDCLFGEADDDVINGDSGNDLASGDAGNDIVNGVQGSDEVLGGVGADRVKGNAGDDTVHGGSENDVVAGGGGQDTLRGEAGDDKVRGAEASDELRGGGGDDRMKGAGGDDTLRGGGGDDRLNCGAGDDVAIANAGDTVSENCETVR